MRHIISALVENKIGVLSKIAGLFSGRGYNIESLAVGETEDPTLSRMTIVAQGDDAIIEQIRKQLSKLIDVIKVTDFMGKEYVERDLLLVKVNAPSHKREEITNLVNIFHGHVVDVAPKEMIVEITGDEATINNFILLIRPYGIKELVRSGRIALLKSSK